jgi:IS30 family transposase
MWSETVYMFEEVKHFMALGESVHYISTALHRNPKTIYRQALRHGETRVAEYFNEELVFMASAEWQESKARAKRMKRQPA